MNKSYEPKTFENEIYAKWQKKGYFKAKVDKNKKPFTIVMPPPNITGQLHMGHALNNTIQDSLIRYKRMKGFEALWIPGTDHASIATEVKIVEKLLSEGTSKEALGRDGFLKEAYAWNDKFGGRIIEQLKKIGCSCDWDRQAFTMDEKCSKAVREVFVKLYNKGLIYRGDRMINWCPDCKTALSDAEVEHQENMGNMWHIKYPVVGEKNKFITVATTRPETLLGDMAVAVNKKDKRYAKFIGKQLSLPLTDRTIPVIADDYVEASFGTGAVKITPAHDPNDFEVGVRHNLERLAIMDESGIMNSNACDYAGMDRFEARKKMIADLDKLGLLEKVESHKNNVGHCYRCDTIIEPLISKQWFVKMQDLADPAIKSVEDGDVKFLPKRFDKTYMHWMNNIRDWCISRQLWWGHRIPAFYCDGCGEMTVSSTDISKCPKCSGKVHMDEDVLDTWFSSALWPFSTLGWPDKSEELGYFYPTDVLVTAYDIIFFWVARMIFSGLENMGEKPFSTVYINGLVRDDKGRKMSKSLNNGIDPLEIIDNYGTDSLRFSLLNGISAGGDTRFSADKIESYRNFMNKIWNASRFVLMNLEGVEPKDIKDIKNLSIADKWIITRLNEAITTVTKNMDKYEVGLASAKLYDFIWNEFCDWYIELSKTALYSEDKGKKQDTASVLLYVLRTLLKLVHPIAPFITEEIYTALPNNDAESIMISAFPEPVKGYAKEAKTLDKIMDVIRAIRNLRAERGVSQSKRTAIHIMPLKGNEKDLQECASFIEKLGMGNAIHFSKPEGKSAEIITEMATIYIPMGDLVDITSELERLNKELKTTNSELSRAEGKLKNTGFTDKAPQKLIDEEKEKVTKYKELSKKLEQSIQELKNM